MRTSVRSSLFGALLWLAAPAAAQAPLGCPESPELEVLLHANQARTAGTFCNGVYYPPVSALELDVRLMEAAQLHSDDMATGDFVSHTGTGGTSAGQRITAAGYGWWGWAENIAAGQPTPAQAVNAWLSSATGHCEALMDPDFRHLGVGYAWNPQATYVHYWTQKFGTPAPTESRLGPETECPQCSNTLDDEGDGAIDHPADAQCTSGADDREAANAGPTCGLGPELFPLLALLGLARRRAGA